MKINIDYRLVALFLAFFILWRSCFTKTADPFSLDNSGTVEGVPVHFPDSNVNQVGGAVGELSTAATVQSLPDTSESCSGLAPEIPRSGVVENAEKRTTEYLTESTCSGTCGSDIRNPAYPVDAIPSHDPQDNLIREQRRLIREYQSYIKSLRSSCCGRIYAGGNLLDNPLSNKNYEVRPMISGGQDMALNVMADDFSNIMTISPQDAEKYKVSFYDQEPAPARSFGLNASENYPMYHKTFDRSFVSRIPDAPNLVPFKVTPWSDGVSDGYCPASRSCAGSFSPPWSTNKTFSCPGTNFSNKTAPEPESFACSRTGNPSPPPEEFPHKNK